jgi:hypothetical protein
MVVEPAEGTPPKRSRRRKKLAVVAPKAGSIAVAKAGAK